MKLVDASVWDACTPIDIAEIASPFATPVAEDPVERIMQATSRALGPILLVLTVGTLGWALFV